MANTPTNHDLHIMLTKLDGKISLILAQGQDNKEWQDKHESNDNKRFKDIDKKIGGYQKYGISLAIVAAFIGASFNRIIEMFK